MNPEQLKNLNEEVYKRCEKQRKLIAAKFKDLPPYTEEELNAPPDPRVKEFVYRQGVYDEMDFS